MKLPADLGIASVALTVAVHHCAPLAAITLISLPTFVRTAVRRSGDQPGAGAECQSNIVTFLSGTRTVPVPDLHRPHRQNLTAVPDRVAHRAPLQPAPVNGRGRRPLP